MTQFFVKLPDDKKKEYNHILTRRNARNICVTTDFDKGKKIYRVYSDQGVLLFGCSRENNSGTTCDIYRIFNENEQEIATERFFIGQLDRRYSDIYQLFRKVEDEVINRPLSKKYQELLEKAWATERAKEAAKNGRPDFEPEIFKALSWTNEDKITKTLSQDNIKNIYIDYEFNTNRKIFTVRALDGNQLFGCVIFKFNIIHGEFCRLFDKNGNTIAEGKFLTNVPENYNSVIQNSAIYKLAHLIESIRTDNTETFNKIHEINKLRGRIKAVKARTKLLIKPENGLKR